MKYLVPVDISQIASNALKYAVDMCGAKDEITVFHAWNNAGYPIHDQIGYIPPMDTEEMLNMIEVMIDVLNIPKGGPKIKTIIDAGEPVHTITTHLLTNAYDAIIMGVKDKHDPLGKIFGTISLGVVKRSDIPVYLIPRDYKYAKPRRVLVAADYHFESEELIEELLKWNKKSKAALVFYHVNDQPNDDDSFKTKLLTEVLDKRNLPYPISYKDVQSANVSKTLLKTCEQEKCDMILVVTNTQSWLEALLFQSVSKEMILKATKPLIFLHAKSDMKDQVKKKRKNPLANVVF